MSEADSLDRDLPESITPKEALPATEGWQTVDCPGAISIDSLPRASSAAPDSNPAAVDPTPDAVTELELLRQDNAELRDRITQLEQDFTQGQIEWQLETARLLHQVAESTPPEQSQAVQSQLTTAQEQLSRVFQELELSHQTAQRQQILIETLTEQLESGQERIAELERDCALTQQRYNEEVQQRLQADAACRDLRIRLNRQQQHTLQFKVALEKCLEMPGPGGRSMPELDLNQTFAAGEFTSADPIVAVNSPVQPWSAPVNQLNLKPVLAHLLQDTLTGSIELPFPKSAIDPSSEPTPADRTTQEASDLMNQIFPDLEPPMAASDLSPAIFDIQPLLEESGAINPALSTQVQQASDTLWQDLTAIIDPPTAGAAAEGHEIPALGPTASAGSEPGNLQNTLQVLGLGTAIEEPPHSVSRAFSPPLFSGSPSPVVYPLRPTKKRESLAAVELPTFPRKGQ